MDLEKAWHPWEGNFRLALCFRQGMEELNNLFPNRTQGPQEGTVGDLAHRAEGTGSDHNPNSAGVVRAWDIDVTGKEFDAQKLANYLAKGMRTRSLSFFGDTGYVIFNRQITLWQPWGTWAPYKGSDPHDRHIHVSAGSRPTEYDNLIPWGLSKAFSSTSASSPTTQSTLEEDMGVIIRNGNVPQYGYLYNGKFVILKSGNTLNAMRAAGVKVVVADPADFSAFVRAYK